MATKDGEHELRQLAAAVLLQAREDREFYGNKPDLTRSAAARREWVRRFLERRLKERRYGRKKYGYHGKKHTTDVAADAFAAFREEVDHIRNERAEIECLLSGPSLWSDLLGLQI